MARLSKILLEIWGRNNLPVNTYIGGMGHVYDDEIKLSNIMNLSPGGGDMLPEDIQNLSISDDNNIEFLISKNYDLRKGGDSLFANSNISWYVDAGGKIDRMTNRHFIDNCTNLVAIYAPNVEALGQSHNTGSMGGLTALRYAIFDNLNSATERNIGNRVLNGATSLRMLSLDSLTDFYDSQIAFSCLQNLTGLKRLNIRNFKGMQESFYTKAIIRDIFNNINPDCKIYMDEDMGLKERKAYARFTLPAINIGSTFTVNGLTYTAVAGEPTAPGEYQVDNLASHNRHRRLAAVINDDTRTGTLGTIFAYGVAFSSMMSFISDQVGDLGNSITYSVNGGPFINFTRGHDIHPLTRYFTDRGCTIIWNNNTILPVGKASNLSAILTGNSLQVNFTPPIPNAHGIHGYEIWVDDFKTPWMKFVPFDEIEEEGESIDVTGFDLSDAVIKIRTFDGQMRYSDFTDRVKITNA